MAEEAAATNQPQVEEQVIVVEEPRRIMTGTEVLVEGGIPRTATKVAIVGFAPTTLPQVRAYFGDPQWEIWPINQLYVAMPIIVEHATRWFQFHARSSYNIALRDHNHHKWLVDWSTRTRKPVYTMQREPDIPTSIEFPRWRIKEQFRSYFTNTISWLIALAAYEKFETVAIFGVDMACDEEYQEQRPSVEFYLGWAEGQCLHSDFCPQFRKPNVYIPPACDICSFLWEYPYEDGQRFKIKCDQRQEELGQRMSGHAAEEQQAHGTRLHCIGGLDLLNQFIAEAIDKPDFEFTRENVKAYFEAQRQTKRNTLGEAAEAEQRAHDARQQLMGAKENMRYIQQSWNQHHRWLATQLHQDSEKKQGETSGEHIQGITQPDGNDKCGTERELHGAPDGNPHGAIGSQGGVGGRDNDRADNGVDMGKQSAGDLQGPA